MSILYRVLVCIFLCPALLRRWIKRCALAQKVGGKGKIVRQTYSMSNRYKGVPHRIRKGLISFRISFSICCKVSWAHRYIIHPI